MGWYMNNIVLPDTKFDCDILDQENHEIGDQFLGKYFNSVISIDDWVEMQIRAEKLLSEWEANEGTLVSPNVLFWKSIINGVVPRNLRITRPDPIKNLR